MAAFEDADNSGEWWEWWESQLVALYVYKEDTQGDWRNMSGEEISGGRDVAMITMVIPEQYRCLIICIVLFCRL